METTTTERRQGLRRTTPWLLRRVSQRYGAVVNAHLTEEGLGGLARPAYWLLMALASGATDATGLVGPMGVTKQAVSKTVDSLVSGGFVHRQPNEADRRRTDLVLTPKGTKTVQVIRDAVRDAERDFVDEVGAGAWATTVATLGALVQTHTDARPTTSSSTTTAHSTARTTEQKEA